MTEKSSPEDVLPAETKQSYREILVWAYFVIAIGFAIYGTFFGETSHRGFFFNFGRSLVWPFLLFPVLGNIVGGIFIVLLVIFLMASG